ncbi:MAG: hypothetical protein OHK0017_11670 [Patescibacteria group bacterium]
MPNSRPHNTLFLLQSIDAKISTGIGDERDVDSDFPQIDGLKEGLPQYYDLELRTDLCSLNSGKVQAKVGVNTRDLDSVKKLPVDFVVIDNLPHLNLHGCEYFAKKSKRFILVTTNPSHPANDLQEKYDNIVIFKYKNNIDFVDMFERLYSQFQIPRVTIQTGGTLNAQFLRLGLIDELSIVVAPCLIGGEKTQSLIGGASLENKKDLELIKTFKIEAAQILDNSYLHLRYLKN